ncbi:hypothetical protein MRB53_038268 [Persea americana]|nr:hypothetical protein MRB53_038268 [Persea americana]
MIRFINGTPSYVWLSEHANGEAFTWAALPKNGIRVITYSANGTHANWATLGFHDHTIPDVAAPIGFILDHTGNGSVWDPTLSSYFYEVTFPVPANSSASSSAIPTFAALPDPYSDVAAPVNWLYFTGQFGDDQLPTSDPRQKEFFGFYKYTAGPTGPRDKQLNRLDVCPVNSDPCIHRTVVTPGE